jgi:DDE superfamily endonuclease
MAGAILAPGRRTVSSALRAMGLDQEKRFHRYHRVLSRASWSSREASRILLGLLVEAFVPEGDPLVVGIDEILERRWGKKISYTRASTVIRCVLPMKTSLRPVDCGGCA